MHDRIVMQGYLKITRFTTFSMQLHYDNIGFTAPSCMCQPKSFGTDSIHTQSALNTFVARAANLLVLPRVPQRQRL